MSEAARRRPGAGPKIEVVRLGGSLLLPTAQECSPSERLEHRLESWIRDREGVRVWIAGTGAWGDTLRRLQAPLGLDEETCHWAAIGLMSAAAEVLRATLPNAEAIRDASELQRRLDAEGGASSDIVFDVGPFLREVEPALPGRALAQDWSVTSDSIAARVASYLRADVLTLIKSCPPPESRSVQAWSDGAVVDAFFPRVVEEEVELRWVDLSRDVVVERRYPPIA